MERTFSVHETAKILGLCLDSVRRHLRSGLLPGVRVGRNWRIAESHLAAYLGVESLDANAAPRVQPEVRAKPSRPKARPQEKGDEVVSPLLRTAPVRAQIIDLVEQAAVNADLPTHTTQLLLLDLDTRLRRG